MLGVDIFAFDFLEFESFGFQYKFLAVDAVLFDQIDHFFVYECDDSIVACFFDFFLGQDIG